MGAGGNGHSKLTSDYGLNCWQILPMVTRTSAAISVFSALPHPENIMWLIVDMKQGAQITVPQHFLRRIRASADVDDVCIHDLWHSVASRALDLGESLPMVCVPLGHSLVLTAACDAYLQMNPWRRCETGVRPPPCGPGCFTAWPSKPNGRDSGKQEDMSAVGRPEPLPCRYHTGSDHAVHGMVIDEPYGLHERIHGGGSDEGPAASFQFLRESD